MSSTNVRPSDEDEAIAGSSTTEEPTSGAAQESPSPEDVILLMVDDSGKPPGYSGSVPLEPSPEEMCEVAVTGQG